MKILYVITGLFIFFIEFISSTIKSIDFKKRVCIMIIVTVLITLTYINFSIFVVTVIALSISGLIVYTIEESHSRIMVEFYKSVLIVIVYLIVIISFGDKVENTISIESNKNDYIVVPIKGENYTLSIPKECMTLDRVDLISYNPSSTLLPTLEIHIIGCKK